MITEFRIVAKEGIFYNISLTVLKAEGNVSLKEASMRASLLINLTPHGWYLNAIDRNR